MTRNLLDLYGGQGGAGAGYERAGWTTFAVDSDKNHARYYPGWFHHGDVLEVLRTLLAGGGVRFSRRDGSTRTMYLSDFQAVHASPPCQRYTRGNAARDTTGYPDLIAATRDLLILTGLPYVIENVEDARAELREPMLLCGSMFGLSADDEDGHPLRLERHRLFESNRVLRAPSGCAHNPSVTVAGSYGGARREGATPAERRWNARHKRKGGYVPNKAVRESLLEVTWMTGQGLDLCIPPAYAEWIGRQLLSAGSRQFAQQDSLF